jgi:hypothetical protein
VVIARWVMVCGECQKPVEVGDVIEKRQLVWADDVLARWVHADCSHMPSDTERKRTYASLNARMRRRARRSG